MASSLTISGFACSPTGVTIGQPVNVSIVISNSSAAAINILNAQLTAIPTGDPGLPTSAALSVIPLSAGQVVSVPALGSLALPVSQVIFPAPSTGANSGGSSTYTVNCLVNAADGENIVAPTGVAVAVSGISLPASQSGQVH